MNTAYKYRIYPDAAQRELLAKTFGCTRFIYNKMLEDKINVYKDTGKMLRNTPAQYKNEFPWLKEVDSLALANAQINLETAFQNFFNSQNTGFPKFKSKKYSKKSYTTNCVGSNIKLSKTALRLPKVGEIKIKLHRPVPDGYELKSVTVSQTSSGAYYASILYEYDSHPEQVAIQSSLGLDFSMHELYVNSEGREANYPRYYRQTEKKLAAEQRKLSHMQKGSKNRDKQRRKVAKLHEHIANQRKDFMHKQSRKITNAYDCVCIEDLNMKAMSKSLNFGKSVADNGWGMFTAFLKYKLENEGKQLVRVDKFFPSSQLCSYCGFRNPGVKDLSIRRWTCPACGKTHNRDVNAAINIRNEGLRLLSA